MAASCVLANLRWSLMTARAADCLYHNRVQMKELSDADDPCDERVATRVDYPRIAHLLPTLRNKTDPNPAIVAPHQPVYLQYGAHCDCPGNTYRYLKQHPDATPIKCFRIWLADNAETGSAINMSAQFHIMPLHNGKYIEVTPPEKGDEDKNFMIVPTSRAYPEWTARELIDFHHVRHFKLSLGGVFYPPSWCEYQQRLRGSARAQCDAASLVVYARPYMYDLPSYCPRETFAQLSEAPAADGRLTFQLKVLLELTDAKRWQAEDKSPETGKEVKKA
jgi:hypothetical protein